jgi:hypothetical protein
VGGGEIRKDKEKEMSSMIKDLMQEVGKEKANAVAKKTYTFNAILKEFSARKTEDKKVIVRLNFDVVGHPYRNTYIKEVSVNYLLDVLPLLNRYLEKQDKTEDLDGLLSKLQSKNISIKMWSSSFFDKAKDKYVTDCGFIEK